MQLKSSIARSPFWRLQRSFFFFLNTACSVSGCSLCLAIQTETHEGSQQKKRRRKKLTTLLNSSPTQNSPPYWCFVSKCKVAKGNSSMLQNCCCSVNNRRTKLKNLNGKAKLATATKHLLPYRQKNLASRLSVHYTEKHCIDIYYLQLFIKEDNHFLCQW